VDGAVEALLGELLGLAGPRAETGTPEQPLGFCGPETASVNGNSSCAGQTTVSPPFPSASAGST
jgi:hypothetical protein